MGNIQTEVAPFKVRSRLRRESIEVNRISMHHPVSPHFKKFFARVTVFSTLTSMIYVLRKSYNLKAGRLAYKVSMTQK